MIKITYIYCYENKINHKKYVGQTNNIERRKREHLSASKNENNPAYNTIFHKSIRKYGINNFIFTILEECEDEQADQKEIFWIKELNTYYEYQKGYNLTFGGNSYKNISSLDEKLIENIQEDLIKGIDYDTLSYKYQISKSYLSDINNGKKFKKDNLSYPLFQYYKTDDQYNKLYDLLINSSKTLKQIVQELNIGESTVKKINYGKMRFNPNIDYPIRKGNSLQRRSLKIKELLLTTNLSFYEISNQLNVSIQTVERINNGQTFNDVKLKYPLR